MISMKGHRLLYEALDLLSNGHPIGWVDIMHDKLVVKYIGRSATYFDVYDFPQFSSGLCHMEAYTELDHYIDCYPGATLLEVWNGNTNS